MLDLKYFPFSNIRQEQQDIIDMINNNPDKKYIIIEAATGIGKSPLAVEAALSNGNGYIVTDSIQLQNQYEADFKNMLVSMKGKSNYVCNTRPTLKCDSCSGIQDISKFKNCIGNCAYYKQKRKATESNVFLTNYSYFLSSCINDPNFKQRNTIIFDEAHLIEKHLTDTFTVEYCYDDFEEKYAISNYATDEEIKVLKKSLKSFNGNYYQLTEALGSALEKIEAEINQQYEKVKQILQNGTNNDAAIEDFIDHTIDKSSKSLYEIQNLLESIRNFNLAIDEDWITGISKTEDYATKNIKETLQLKPLKVDWIFNSISEKATDNIYFMSATILDKSLFCQTLGIDENETLFIRKDSPFDPNNSPIYAVCTCGTSYAELQDEKNLDQIVDYVNQILILHKNDKGIIHSGNKRISSYLKMKLNNPRLLVNVGSLNNREIYEMHLKSKQPTVLVSSSMSEGVDLKDDLSRFQIIVKLPFESLADVRVKELTKARPNWYQCEMMKKLIQQCGRSTRSSNDTCKTYVLDDNFIQYYKYAVKRNWLTNQFVKRCRRVDDSPI